MSDKPVDLEAEREARRAKLEVTKYESGRALYMCDCGCGLFNTWTDGSVECANCRADLAIEVAETPA
jgi:hypothetical protein